MNWIDNSQLSLRLTISTWLYALSTFKWYDLARRHVHSFIYRRTKKKKMQKNISNFKWVACILWCFLIPRNFTRKNRKISDKVWLLFWQWLFITWAANAQFNSLQLKIHALLFCFRHRMAIKFNAITRKSNKICIDYVMNASSNQPIHMVHQRSHFIVHFTLGIAFVWRVSFCSESFLW